MWGAPLKIEKDLERPREKNIPFVFSFEKTDGQCHADDYFGLLNCQKGRISLLIKGLLGSAGAGCWRLARRGARRGVRGDGGAPRGELRRPARPGTARHGPWEPWHPRRGIPGSEAGRGLVPRTRGAAGGPGPGAGITGWRWMEPPIAPDAVSAPGQLLSPEGWTD